MLSETGGITNGKYQKTRKQLFARRIDGLHTRQAAAQSAAEDGQAANRAYAKADRKVVTGAGDDLRDELQEAEPRHRSVDHAGKIHRNLAAKACSTNTKPSAQRKQSATTDASRPKMTMCSAEKV